MQVLYQRYPVGVPVVYEVGERNLDQVASDLPDSDVSQLSVLIFDPGLETAPPTPGAFGDRFRDLTQSSVESADLIVLRGSGAGFVPTISTDLVFQEDFERKGKSVAALVSRLGRGQAAPRLERLAGVMPVDLASLLPIAREAEIVSLLRLSGAVLEAGDQYHFLLPAGPHAPTFLRIADALQDLTAVRRIAEWVLPHLSERSAVLADSRSLTPLLLQIQSMLIEDERVVVPVESFPEYPKDERDFGLTVAEFELRNPGRETMFLLSVNSSGNLLRQMKERTRLRGGRIVVVCDTKCERDPGDAVVLSKMPIRRWEPDANGRCRKCDDFHDILIHPSSFERIANPRFEPVKVSLDPISELEWFWESAEATGAVRLHHRAPYPSGFDRHFAVYVDVAKLLGANEFRRRCLEALGRLPRPSVVLVTEHSAAGAIRDLIAQRFAEGWGGSNDLTDLPDLHILPTNADIGPLVRNLHPSEWVLIADDALVAGTTMRTWRQKVHAIAVARGGWINLAGFVALARPRSGEAMRTLRNLYTQRRGATGKLRFRWGAYLCMPVPGIDDCPGCVEDEVLSWFGSKLEGAAKEFADSRLAQLRTGNLLNPLLTDPERRVPDTALHTEGSFFGRLTPVTAMAAAMCAAHALSVSLSETLSHGVVQQVDTAHFIGSFFESVFHAGVLRTVPRRQIFSPELESRLRQELAQWPQLARDGGLVETTGFFAEFGWAVVNGKLPAIPVMQLIDQVQDKPPALQLVRRLIELNVGRGIEN